MFDNMWIFCLQTAPSQRDNVVRALLTLAVHVAAKSFPTEEWILDCGTGTGTMIKACAYVIESRDKAQKGAASARKIVFSTSATS